jgi:hypothetical protein
LTNKLNKGGIYMTIKTGEKMYAADILNLTFFPKGTILTFSTEAWNNATNPGFKDIWKVCNAANHAADPAIPDLTNVFLRGADSSGTTGGADSGSVTLNTTHLPEHNHSATGLSLSGLSLTPLSLANMAVSGLTISGGEHEHPLSGGTSSTAHSHTGTGTTNSGSGGHTHSVSGSTGEMSGDTYGEYSISPTRGPIRSDGNCSGRMTRGTSYAGCADTATSPGGYGARINLAHTHGFSGSTPAGEGGHSHDVNVTITDNGSHAHDFTSASKATSATHGHTVSGGTITGDISGGSITGGEISGSTANAGAGQPFSVDTVPAYYTVIYIIKAV